MRTSTSIAATKTPTVAVTPANGDASLLTAVVQPFREPHELRPYSQIIAEGTSSQSAYKRKVGEDTHPNRHARKKKIDPGRSSSTDWLNRLELAELAVCPFVCLSVGLRTKPKADGKKKSYASLKIHEKKCQI